MGLVMKLWTNNGEWFYGGGNLSRVKVRRARFGFYRYGIFFDFQTNPYCWNCIAGLIPGNNAEHLASIERSKYRLDNLFLVLGESGAGDEQT
jgi:hypothetical protein